MLLVPGINCDVLQEMSGHSAKKRGRPAGPTAPRSPTPKRRSQRPRSQRNSSDTRPGDAKPPKTAAQMQASKAYHRKQRAKPHRYVKRRARNGIAKSVKFRRNTRDRRRAKKSKAAVRDRRDFACGIRDALLAELKTELSVEQQKKIALTTFYAALGDQGYGRGAAADFVHSVMGFHRETVLRWARELEFTLFVCPGDLDPSVYAAVLDKASFWESLRGKHGKMFSLLADPDTQGKARAWVQGKLASKNDDLRVDEFQFWLNQTLLKEELAAAGLDELSYSTAREFLLNLGFEFGPRRKGIDPSLHERPDVVLDRAEYLAAMKEEKAAAAVSGARTLIIVVQDEAVARTKAKRSHGWKEKGRPGSGSLGKDTGVGVMDSDFLTEEKGYMSDSRVVLEFGRDGYFTAERFEKQVCCFRCTCSAFVSL